MSSSVTKLEILRIFKALHRSCRKTFQDDAESLAAMIEAVNENFRKNKAETDPEKIKKLYEDAITVEDEIRTKLIQVVEVEPGRHRVKLEPDHCNPTFQGKKERSKRKEKRSE